MFSHLETTLVGLVEEIPLEVFTFVASFIEEVIAPIPSAGVLLLTGSFAAVQERTIIELIPLVLIAALGKSLGAIIVYSFADVLSRYVFGRFGNFLRVSDADLRDLGARITGTTKDYLILTACRALPIVPSSIVSVGCGVLKVPFRLFMITTVIGTIVRDSIFIYAGYTGIEFMRRLLDQSVSVESYIQMGIITLIGLVFVFVYLRRRNKSTP
jgi:membrane protein DedA with SNARE-associated domain